MPTLVLNLFTAAFLSPSAFGGEVVGSGNHGPQSIAEAIDQKKSTSVAVIIHELTCAVRESSPKSSKQDYPLLETFAREFHRIWSRLDLRGIKFPTRKDRAHFYSQILYESNNLNWLREKKPALSKIIGGQKWLGRGPVQLTGCPNYAALAQFELNLRNRDLLGPRLFTTGMSSFSPENCPPAHLSKRAIMAIPEHTMENHPMGGYGLSALSAIYWWEDRKFRSRTTASRGALAPMKLAVEMDSEQSVKDVTRYVKNSTDTSERRYKNFKALQKCMESSK